MADIRETVHYQIYLEVTDALNKKGYEIIPQKSSKKFVMSYVTRDSSNYGQLFVVAPPKMGCLASIFIRPFTKGLTQYETMRGVADMVRNSRKRGKVYWPNNSLVGGFTSNDGGYMHNEHWLSIMESVISGK
jgi:hypothetical protein